MTVLDTDGDSDGIEDSANGVGMTTVGTAISVGLTGVVV